MNKATRGDAIPTELFQILKDDAVKVLQSICQQISAMATGLEKASFIPVPKKGSVKDCSNYHTISLISHAIKVTLKILQARLQSTWTKKFQMYKLDLEKAEEPEIKLPMPFGS